MTDRPVSRRAMIRLIRFAVSAGSLAHASALASSAPADAELTFTGPDGTARPFRIVLVREAVAIGLLVPRRDPAEGRDADGAGQLLPGAEARAFLRRAAAEIEEEAYAGQHRVMEKATLPSPVDDRPVSLPRNLSGSPLALVQRLRERDGSPYLSPEAFAAGERLAVDFERAGLQPRITASWEPRLNTGSGRRGAPVATISDTASAAAGRLSRALDAIGPELSGAALDICCFAKGLEAVERERQWPPRSAKLMLRTALMALARHYSPPSRPTGPAARHTLHWGSADYRPEL